ncbi:hypothetical protein MKS88_000644 [Plasmodium brasilianum]|uniref:Uncharacterized protein n=3 Tax=Plasmodium brasilianum TaxID=5824 RepID=A0ACB9YEI2_PLABR|nr:hypothetical protein MKS88_000644 [Plasmodium brasilianum]
MIRKNSIIMTSSYIDSTYHTGEDDENKGLNPIDDFKTISFEHSQCSSCKIWNKENQEDNLIDILSKGRSLALKNTFKFGGGKVMTTPFMHSLYGEVQDGILDNMYDGTRDKLTTKLLDGMYDEWSYKTYGKSNDKLHSVLCYAPSEGSSVNLSNVLSYAPSEGSSVNLSNVLSYAPSEGSSVNLSNVLSYAPSEGSSVNLSNVPSYAPSEGSSNELRNHRDDIMNPFTESYIKNINSIKIDKIFKYTCDNIKNKKLFRKIVDKAQRILNTKTMKVIKFIIPFIPVISMITAALTTLLLGLSLQAIFIAIFAPFAYPYIFISLRNK